MAASTTLEPGLVEVGRRGDAGGPSAHTGARLQAGPSVGTGEAGDLAEAEGQGGCGREGAAPEPRHEG